jgi:hypothetical protein
MDHGANTSQTVISGENKVNSSGTQLVFKFCDAAPNNNQTEEDMCPSSNRFYVGIHHMTVGQQGECTRCDARAFEVLDGRGRLLVASRWPSRLGAEPGLGTTASRI